MLYPIIFGNYSMSASEKVIVFLTFVFSVLFAITLHEFSHAFVAHKLGDRTPKMAGRLTFSPMAHFDALGLVSFFLFGFGWAKPVPINPYNFKNIKRDTFLVSIAGIFSNLVVAFLFYPLSVLFLNLFSNSGSVFLLILYYLCLFLCQTNLVLAVFNLLPVHPLDGFNAIASHLSYNNKFVVFNLMYGRYVLLALILIFNFTNLFQTIVGVVGYPIMAFWSLFL